MEELKTQRLEKQKAVRHMSLYRHTSNILVYIIEETFLFLLFSQLAEEKRVEAWRTNCPELRQVGVRQREKAMESTWKEQVQHKTQVNSG